VSPLSTIRTRRRHDAALTSRAARADAAAFADVYDRHHHALYRYCRSILRHDEDGRCASRGGGRHGRAGRQEMGQQRGARGDRQRRRQRGQLRGAPAKGAPPDPHRP
jgi:hypothetical protein